jgi:hypothetical protein
MKLDKDKVYYLKEKIMKINLGKSKELNLDLNKTTSIMLVGKCGTGKTCTTKEILRKAKEEYDNLDVLYVDYHAADYNDVRGIVGDLLNEKHLLTEPELKSLHDVVMAQQKLRNQFICDEGVTTLDELIGKEITTFVIGGREYMPDDIVWYYEDGQQKWLLADKYYEKRMVEGNLYFSHKRSSGKYNPTRLLLCFDEFYTSDMSEEGQRLVHDLALSIIRFGRADHQSIILSTQHLSQHREYGDIYRLAPVKVYFHSGFDDEVECGVLFNKRIPRDVIRGDVTFTIPDSKPINDGKAVSKLWEAIDDICVSHNLEDFSLSDIKMLSQILENKIIYLNKMFDRRLLHIIEVTRELDFSDCADIHVSWHCVGKDINVSVLIHQLPNDYSISAKMLNMSDEDLVNNKDLCKYIGNMY